MASESMFVNDSLFAPSDETLLAVRQEERNKPQKRDQRSRVSRTSSREDLLQSSKHVFSFDSWEKPLRRKSTRLAAQKYLFASDASDSMSCSSVSELSQCTTNSGFISRNVSISSPNLTSSKSSYGKNNWSDISIEENVDVGEKKRRSKRAAVKHMLESSLKRKKTLIASTSKKPWTEREDRTLAEAIDTFGAQSWSRIAKCLPGRIGKQCRERWHNHLCPSVKKGNWTQEEDQIIFKQHKLVGNQWALIAKHVQGRTDNAIKNRYYSTMRKLNRQASRVKAAPSTTKKSKPKKNDSDSVSSTCSKPKSESKRSLEIVTDFDAGNYNCFQSIVAMTPTGLSLPPGFQRVGSANSHHSLHLRNSERYDRIEKESLCS